MTSKQRLLTALHRGVPDRLPVTIHQWQRYHLERTMGGIDQLEAFGVTGLDASISTWRCVRLRESDRWRVHREGRPAAGSERHTRIRVQTPDGELTAAEAAADGTAYMTEHLIKGQRDAELFIKHWPNCELDRQQVAAWYDRTGDDGIVRGFVGHAHQPGAWQDFCELVGTQEAILWAVDDPAFVHHFLDRLTQFRVAYVHEQMAGAKFDLIEHGGGAASSSVISPAMFDEFCVPYDRRVTDALHEEGFPVVYHTCGGMLAILGRVPANGCDASETLSPPGVGGDIATRDHRVMVKRTLGTEVALIGGIDQGRLEHPQPAEAIREEVVACFETFGTGGGYICSASDHFFHAPVENLKALAAAAADCRYG